ncbi:hypothetical protein LEN26_011687 [Aphanomyces euteiches]|nr:hypothetical protein LEN26_011687 [Aphanomyces euteiches]
MMDSTLLGNEECRKYGYQWLCEKALYMALAAHPYSPFGGRIDDDLIVSMQLGEDHTGTKIEAAQGHSQFTVFGNYSDVAQACWDTLLQELSSTVIDKIHDDLVYFYIEYGPMKTKLLRLAGMFRLKNRIVITQTTIAYDERYPMKEQESRLHGFGWTILDEIGEGITLWRQSNLFYTPVNQSRPLVLEEIGDFVHYQLQEGEPRETSSSTTQWSRTVTSCSGIDLSNPSFPSSVNSKAANLAVIAPTLPPPHYSMLFVFLY